MIEPARAARLLMLAARLARRRQNVVPASPVTCQTTFADDLTLDVDQSTFSQGRTLGVPGSGHLRVSAGARAETLLHRTADAHAPKLSVAIRYAFAVAKKAARRQDDPRKAASVFVTSVRAALKEVLPKALHRTVVAGGATGVVLLKAQLRGAEEFRSAKRETKAKIEFAYDDKTEAAISWADKHAAELIDGISETSREQISNAVAEFLETGNWKEYRDEVLDAVGDEDRADRIARNESMVAVHEGQREAWDQAVEEGLLTGDELREWIVVGDDKVCPICEALEGKTAKLGETYESDGEEFDGPPAHPMCRCSEGITGSFEGLSTKEASFVEVYEPEIETLGGPGSGNFGHAGRPGEVGGSSSEGGDASTGAPKSKRAPVAAEKIALIHQLKSEGLTNGQIAAKAGWYHKEAPRVQAVLDNYHPDGTAKDGSTKPEAPKPETPKVEEPKSTAPIPVSERSAHIEALLKSGTAPKHAVLNVPQDTNTNVAHVKSIGSGAHIDRAVKEYANTPTQDLQVLSAIEVHATPVQGQAHCTWDRKVVMGSTSVTGDFRHELGHAIHMSLSPSLQNHVEGLHKEALAKAKANPAGMAAKLSHDFYEKTYGVIGRRAMDNWHEDFAEHYRGYHKAIYQTKSGENKEALNRYDNLHPKWSKFWDAYYAGGTK